MELPEDAEILETDVIRLESGSWFAGIRFRVPGQGGYDRAPADDMFRIFDGDDAEARAHAWLKKKLGRH